MTSKERYISPEVEEIILQHTCSPLVSLSVQGEIDEFEDGGEL